MATTIEPRKIVYLIGAGATQAEVDFIGAPLNVLMSSRGSYEGISQGIISRLSGSNWPGAPEQEGIDIEKLISLSAASGQPRLVNAADDMRRAYFEEICSRLGTTEIIARPRLLIGLLQMHATESFRANIERLTGVITTNHDGLVQVASQRVFGGLQVGFAFESEAFAAAPLDTPPMLQMHGSFSWQFGEPMNVEPLTATSGYSPEATWLPPAVSKDSKTYPFNKLAALAHELLSACDVLRVIGSSMTQNDWNILSLIFNAQRQRITAFRVELIMSHETGTNLVKHCSFIKQLFPIGFLTEGDFSPFKDTPRENLDPSMRNTFAYWLGQKVRYHQGLGHFGSDPLHSDVLEALGESS